MEYRGFGSVYNFILSENGNHRNAVYNAVCGEIVLLRSAVSGDAAHLNESREQIDECCGLIISRTRFEQTAVVAPADHKRYFLAALICEIFAAAKVTCRA